VILGAGLDQEERLDRAVVPVSLAASPWLNAHRVEGRILMPLAAMLQQCAAAACRIGLTVPFTLVGASIVDMVVVEEARATNIAVSARGSRSSVHVALDRLGAHASSPVLRVDATPAAGPLPLLTAPQGDYLPGPSLREFYSSGTFHGPELQALTQVLAAGPEHAEALVRSSEAADPEGSALDLLAVDGMLQLCAYWAFTNLGRIGLPTAAGEVRVLRSPEAGEMLRVLGVLKGISGDTIDSDLDLLDAAGTAVVQIRGLRCRLHGDPDAAVRPVDRPAAEAIDPSTWRIEAFPEVKALHDRLEMARAAGVENPYFSVHERVTNDTSLIGGREYVNFASYNYLGLSGDPDVTRAAVEALARYGSSVSASRLASGEKPLHLALERGIADLLGCEDAIVMVGGHATNVSVIGHMLGPQDLVIHDSLAHDSILAGIRLSGAKRRAFPHNDVEGLEWLLARLRPTARRVLIAIEGVYSMDGDIAPLDRIVDLKRRHHALLLVDEAHSLGVLGRTGRGIGELYEVDRRDVDLWMGTLSKSLASCGGYIAGSHALVRYLKYTNPGFVYSVGISPPNAAAALAALQKLRELPSLVSALQARSRTFLEASRRHALDTGLSGGTAVIPCIVGNSHDCLRLSRALAGRAINVQPILYPAVEERGSRLRFFVTARHTDDQIQAAVAACAEELARLDPGRRSPVGAGARHGGTGA
jgi:8-amino-7-oxononanoate synthase